MAKNVILTIEYDMGDYSEVEEDGNEIPTDPMNWRESFIQSDVDLSEMKIVGVRVEEATNAD